MTVFIKTANPFVRLLHPLYYNVLLNFNLIKIKILSTFNRMISVNLKYYRPLTQYFYK
jgi:hypothetical protein